MSCQVGQINRDLVWDFWQLGHPFVPPPLRHPSRKRPASQWKQVEQSPVLTLSSHLVLPCPLCCSRQDWRPLRERMARAEPEWSPPLHWLHWPLSATYLLQWPSSPFCILRQSCGSFQHPRERDLALIVCTAFLFNKGFFPTWIQSNSPLPSFPAVAISAAVVFLQMGKARHGDVK